jgi:hypothetical protein
MPDDLSGDHPAAIAALARGIVDGAAERKRRAQLRPEVYARLIWWLDGARGHYPGCDCRPHHAGSNHETDTTQRPGHPYRNAAQ